MPPPGQPADLTSTLEVDALFRRESGRVLAGLIGRLGDFDLAEESLQDAFTVALERWPRDGLPDQPAAWITTTARNKAIDRLRRGRRQGQKRVELEALARSAGAPGEDSLEEDAVSPIVDDRLRLIFTCCHPALAAEARVALTLRTLGGLKTPEIAAAFLVSPATMGQRISRAKAKIRDARIPYRVPRDADLTERLAGVLSTIYLIFNEGYSASSGDRLVRGDLCAEAIRLGRLLAELMPDESEVLSLVSLMLLHDSRRNARVDERGSLVLLPDQDRSRWDRAQIDEGTQLAAKAWRMGAPGLYGLQAAIAAEHGRSVDGSPPDWQRIATLYGLLETVNPSPVVRLNRSVAVSMAGRDQEALAMADGLLAEGALGGYRYLHLARGEFLVRLGRREEAAEAYLNALRLSENEVDRSFVATKLAALAPTVNPSGYPGPIPKNSYFLLGTDEIPVRPLDGRRVGQWRLEKVPKGAQDLLGVGAECALNFALMRTNAACIDQRIPVLAVGSNASPPQLLHKFSSTFAEVSLPVLKANVRGIRLAFSGHVSRWGYIPTAIRAAEDVNFESQVFITFLDEYQLLEIDKSEPNYDRVTLCHPDGGPIIRLESGERLAMCAAYRTKHGILDISWPERTPMPSQADLRRTLIERLLKYSTVPAWMLPNDMKQIPGPVFLKEVPELADLNLVIEDGLDRFRNCPFEGNTIESCYGNIESSLQLPSQDQLKQEPFSA